MASSHHDISGLVPSSPEPLQSRPTSRAALNSNLLTPPRANTPNTMNPALLFPPERSPSRLSVMRTDSDGPPPIPERSPSRMSTRKEPKFASLDGELQGTKSQSESLRSFGREATRSPTPLAWRSTFGIEAQTNEPSTYYQDNYEPHIVPLSDAANSPEDALYGLTTIESAHTESSYGDYDGPSPHSHKRNDSGFDDSDLPSHSHSRTYATLSPFSAEQSAYLSLPYDRQDSYDDASSVYSRTTGGHSIDAGSVLDFGSPPTRSESPMRLGYGSFSAGRGRSRSRSVGRSHRRPRSWSRHSSMIEGYNHHMVSPQELAENERRTSHEDEESFGRLHALDLDSRRGRKPSGQAAPRAWTSLGFRRDEEDEETEEADKKEKKSLFSRTASLRQSLSITPITSLVSRKISSPITPTGRKSEDSASSPPPLTPSSAKGTLNDPSTPSTPITKSKDDKAFPGAIKRAGSVLSVFSHRSVLSNRSASSTSTTNNPSSRPTSSHGKHQDRPGEKGHWYKIDDSGMLYSRTGKIKIDEEAKGEGKWLAKAGNVLGSKGLQKRGWEKMQRGK